MALLSSGVPGAECLAQVRAQVEAFSGQPFGVGRMSFVLGEGNLPQPLGFDGIGLAEKNDRVFYPAVHNMGAPPVLKDVVRSTPLLRGGPIRNEVGGILSGILESPPKTTVYFLFRGNEPLELTLEARTPQTVLVQPQQDPRRWQLLVREWWRNYTVSSDFLQAKPDYPPLVDNFLVTTLARRLNLQLPKQKQKTWRGELGEEIGFALGTESIRIAMQQDRILGLNYLNQVADQPLPPAVPKYPFTLETAEVKVEPIASHVPVECFYIRFGSFANFLWIQDTLTRWGGDAQNLIASRGLDLGNNKRIEQQLVLKQTALSRMLGPTVISDVAIIGTDLYFREGAAMGLLFQARSSVAMASDIAGKRAERVKQGGVTEQKFKIAGKTVSYLSSPDGKVRSYYAADGAYHFITTSKTLVRRFLEAGSGTGSLGASNEFRYARTIMPLDRNDTIFVYLSSEFFRNMVGPHYRIEMIRRLQATSDIDLVQLAKLMAATEGLPGATTEQLCGSGILPRDFGPRPDGSRTVVQGGYVYDSMRGYRGTFVPIPDMPVTQATPAEIAAYQRFTQYYSQRFGRFDPTMVGVKRHDLKEGREQVVVDALMSPLGKKFYDFLAKRVGPPDKLRLAWIPGDIAAGQVVLADRHMFGGVRDFRPPARPTGGPLTGLRDFLVGYIGTDGPMPLIGLLEQLAGAPGVVTQGLFGPRRPGPAVPTGGMFRRQWKQFTVFSLHTEVLDAVVPQLRFEPARRPAQVRLRVVDLTQTQVAPFLNAKGYSRTRETSLGNLRLMHSLEQQFHIPKPDCMEAAEFLLAAKLICPLGGKYMYRKDSGRWTSTAMRENPSGRPPPGYVAPPLSWFRGLNLDATLTPRTLSAHVDVVMQTPKK